MVYHILKDGKNLTTITGHVVKVADAKQVYHLLHNINRTNKNRRIKNDKLR